MIKNKRAIEKMETAGRLLAKMFHQLPDQIKPGVTTAQLDSWIAHALQESGLVSRCKGYMGYQHVSCISPNDVVVHGVPSKDIILQEGDVVTVDVCASWHGYCADMARVFFVGDSVAQEIKDFVNTAQRALDKGLAQAVVGNRLTDISAEVQKEVEGKGYGVVRDFAGHGIGKYMHEDPEVLNYGSPGKGPVLRQGMALAIEPMITFGHHDVFIENDGWTVKTKDKSLAAHVEDTVIITEDGPKIITRMEEKV